MIVGKLTHHDRCVVGTHGDTELVQLGGEVLGIRSGHRQPVRRGFWWSGQEKYAKKHCRKRKQSDTRIQKLV